MGTPTALTVKPVRSKQRTKLQGFEDFIITLFEYFHKLLNLTKFVGKSFCARIE